MTAYKFLNTLVNLKKEKYKWEMLQLHLIHKNL